MKKIKRKVLETKTDSSNERVWVVVCEVRATAYLFQTSLCSASHVTLSAFAAERRAAIDQYLPPAGRSAANPQQRREAGERWDGQTQTDRQTDRQTLDRCIDPAPRTGRAVSVTYHLFSILVVTARLMFVELSVRVYDRVTHRTVRLSSHAGIWK